MLEGLEISELLFSEVQKDNESLRFDSQYFFKEYFHLLEFLSTKQNDRFVNVTSWVTQGPNPTFCAYDNAAVPCLTGRNINKGRVTYADADYIDLAEYASLKKYQIKPGDTLVTLKGLGSIGKIGYVTEKRAAIFSRDVGIIRPKGIEPAYLNAFILSTYGQKLVTRGETGGTGQRTLTTSYLKGLRVPRFTIEKRIGNFVLLSEEVLKKSEAAYQQAETLLLDALNLTDFSPSTANTNTKSFQESFLASGRLDAEYCQPKFDELEAKLAASHTLVSLASLLTVNQRGTQPEYAEEGLPVINSKHVREGEVILSDNRLAIVPDKDDALIIKNGDVLINGTGVGTIGRSAPYLHAQEALPDNHVTVLRTDKVNPVFLSVYLNSLAGKYQVDKYFKGSSGQIELYPKDIDCFYVPVVDESIQTEIESLVKQSYTLKAESTRLLDVAKRAVEIAIEQDEAAALAYIEANL